MFYDFVKIEREEINTAYNDKRYKLENDHLKERAFVFSSFPDIDYYGFHLGNSRSYIYPDIYSRYLRFKGYNVLSTIGYNNAIGDIKELSAKLLSTPEAYLSKGYEVYKNQLKKMQLGYDEDREVCFSDTDYMYFIDRLFQLMVEKGIIKRVKEEVRYTNNNLLDDYEECDSFEFANIDIYKLDLSEYNDKIISEIKKSDINERIFRTLQFHKEYKINLATSNDKNLEKEIADPINICGLSFITINPDLCNYKDYCDEFEITDEDLINLENSVLFSGVIAVNPVNELEIPIFISRYFNEAIHFGYPNDNDIDESYASYIGLDYLPIIDYVDDKKILINSGKYTDMEYDEARIALIKDLEEDNLLISKDVINLNRLVVSTNKKNGVPIPFYLTGEKSKIPVTYDFKRRMRFEDGTIPIEKLDNSFISDNLLKALSFFVVKMTNEVGIADITTKQGIKDASEFSTCDYAMFNSIKELIWVIALNTVIKDYIPELHVDIKHADVCAPVLGSDGNLMERDMNNLVSLDSVINSKGSTALRLFYLLSAKCYQSFNYSDELFKESEVMTEKICRVFCLPLVDKYSLLDYDYQKLVMDFSREMDNYSFNNAFNVIDNFMDKVFERKTLSYEQATGLLVLLSIFVPSLASRIYTDCFNAKEPLDYLCYPE